MECVERNLITPVWIAWVGHVAREEETGHRQQVGFLWLGDKLCW